MQRISGPTPLDLVTRSEASAARKLQGPGALKRLVEAPRLTVFWNLVSGIWLPELIDWRRRGYINNELINDKGFIGNAMHVN